MYLSDQMPATTEFVGRNPDGSDPRKGVRYQQHKRATGGGDTVRVTFWTSQGLRAHIRRRARLRGTSQTAFLIHALRTYLQRVPEESERGQSQPQEGMAT